MPYVPVGIKRRSLQKRMKRLRHLKRFQTNQPTRPDQTSEDNPISFNEDEEISTRNGLTFIDTLNLENVELVYEVEQQNESKYEDGIEGENVKIIDSDFEENNSNNYELDMEDENLQIYDSDFEKIDFNNYEQDSGDENLQINESDNEEIYLNNSEQDMEDENYEINVSDLEQQNIAKDDAKTREPVVEGRRIINAKFFFNQILNSGVHARFSCTIADMEVINEQRHGLRSTFTLQCKMCGITKELNTEETNTEAINNEGNIDINKAITVGAISIGIGFSQCDELMSTLNVPFMAPNTFQKNQEEVSKVISATACSSMEEAAKEEYNLATELGEVESDGIPYITVITDGAWSKRSYNVNYNALSGVACIIGQRTGKLLFLGVRNKYCSVCARNDNIPHLCYKNWNGPSTAMESDIIVDGFKQSLSVHNLKYTRMVGDGDSSVYKKLLETKPYGNSFIEKVECKNHLYRNFNTNLRKICTRTISNSKTLPVPILLRKLVNESINRICIDIKAASQHRIAEETEMNVKILLLKKDIINIPSHVFGEHKNCNEIGYFKCEPAGKPNFIPQMQACGLYEDIQIALHRLIINASSLLLNMSNNDAEHFNSILCKFTGGKRINFSCKNSYEMRCNAAAISFNSKGKYQELINKAFTNHSKIQYYTQQYTNRKRKQYLAQKSHIKRKKFAGPDHHYGLVSDNYEQSDMSEEEYERNKNKFMLEAVMKTPEEIVSLQETTKGQSSNPKWLQERLVRLTASNFGRVCKMKQTTSRAKIVESLLYSKFMGNEHTKYGIDNEPFAKAMFERETGNEIQSCGLFIDGEYNFLGASPDGAIENSIIEIKCPSTIKNLHPREAIAQKILTFAVLDENLEMCLKTNHNYYYQIQGQLQVTKKELCHFIVWSPKGMLIQKIERDLRFWKEKMENQLKTFYFKYMLPELVDPRKKRNQPLRN